MAHPPSYPDTDDTGLGSDRRSTAGKPWLVYAFWIIGIGLVLLMVVGHLTGHLGPGSH
jgi:hypothetical protein